MAEVVWYKNRKNSMRVNQSDEVVYLSWPGLDELDFICHGFSTRLGGVSEGVCSSMNLSFSRGDREEDVHENYRRIAKAIGFVPEKIVCTDQTHTTNIRVVDAGDCGKGVVRPRDYTDIDGLVTNVPGVVLATFYADCVPVYFVDPVKRAIGLVHSGWRGTVGNIIQAGIDVMRREYQTRPENVIAAIGPSICRNCYEISGDVAEEFEKAYPEEEYNSMMTDDGNGKFHLDLWKACKCNLERAGVKSEKIFLSNLCTCCNPEFLFSHRASKGKRGNLAAFLSIKESGEKSV